MPCPICNDAHSGIGSVLTNTRRVTPSDLQRSSETCRYCYIIYSFSKTRGWESEREIRLSDGRGGHQHGGISFFYQNPPFEMRNLVGRPQDECNAVIASGLTSSDSDLSAEWAKGQMEQCLKSHIECVSKRYSVLPDRILAIGSEALTDSRSASRLNSDIYLLESSDVQAEYATLSHRWGNHLPLRLLEENLEVFKKNIPFYDLPKTYRHAVIFARKLGISYLWIDSVCIIQDSKKDWSTQSAKMASIYENCTVTIAASVAQNSQEGCFYDSSEIEVGYITNGHTEIPAQGHRESMHALLSTASAMNPVVFIKALAFHRHPTRYREHRDGALSLYTRAWVYQERLLSPRILHFGAKDIIFECAAVMDCYCKSVPWLGKPPPQHEPVKQEHTRSLRPGADLSMLTKRWCRIVGEYSDLDLTFQSDRLAALAGVAKQFSRSMANPRYISGIWEALAVQCISWERNWGDSNGYPPPVRALPSPSWSWVHFPGSVSYAHLPHVSPEVERIEVHPEDAAENEYIHLQRASIVLSGYVTPVRLRVEEVSDDLDRTRFVIVIPGLNDRFLFQFDYIPSPDMYEQEWHTIRPASLSSILPKRLSDVELNESEDMFHMFDFSYSWNVVRQLSGLAVILDVGMYNDSNGHENHFYLVLQCENEEQQIYRRVGTITRPGWNIPPEFARVNKQRITIV